jgi:hypothetical protein
MTAVLALSTAQSGGRLSHSATVVKLSVPFSPPATPHEVRFGWASSPAFRGQKEPPINDDGSTGFRYAMLLGYIAFGKIAASDEGS